MLTAGMTLVRYLEIIAGVLVLGGRKGAWELVPLWQSGLLAQCGADDRVDDRSITRPEQSLPLEFSTRGLRHLLPMICVLFLLLN